MLLPSLSSAANPLCSAKASPCIRTEAKRTKGFSATDPRIGAAPGFAEQLRGGPLSRMRCPAGYAPCETQLVDSHFVREAAVLAGAE